MSQFKEEMGQPLKSSPITKKKSLFSYKRSSKFRQFKWHFKLIIPLFLVIMITILLIDIFIFPHQNWVYVLSGILLGLVGAVLYEILPSLHEIHSYLVMIPTIIIVSFLVFPVNDYFSGMLFNRTFYENLSIYASIVVGILFGLLIGGIAFLGGYYQYNRYKNKLTGVNSYEELKNLMESRRWWIRKRAVEVGSKIDDKRALDLFIERRIDEDWEVRGVIIEAIAKYKGPKVMEALSKTLKDEESDNVIKAIRALGRIDDPQVKELLSEILQNSPERDIKLALAETLVDLGEGEQVVDILRTLYEKANRNIQIRARVINALKKVGEEAMVVELLVGTVDHHSMSTRSFSYRMIGKTRSKHALRPLIDLLEGSDIFHVYNAAEALGELGFEEAVEPLISLLDHKTRLVRGYSSKALGKLGDTRAIKPLIEVLGDSCWWVRRYAIEALAKLGDRSIINHISTLAETDPDKRVRKAAIKALEQLAF